MTVFGDKVPIEGFIPEIKGMNQRCECNEGRRWKAIGPGGIPMEAWACLREGGGE